VPDVYITYILRSESSGRYYVGCTSDLKRRIEEHNTPGHHYAQARGPWLLVYREEFESLSAARQRENQIKSWRSRRSIEQLVQGG
jgi:putative endonuclease